MKTKNHKKRISPHAIVALREYLLCFSMQDIHRLFRSAGISRRKGLDPDPSPYSPALIEQYYQGIDLAKPGDAKKLVRFIESLLQADSNPRSRTFPLSARDKPRANLLAALQQDGLQWLHDRLSRTQNGSA